MVQKRQVRARMWGYTNSHPQLVGMHTGMAQATCNYLIRARVTDPKTSSSVGNSYQAPYNNIYENNRCDAIYSFRKLKPQAVYNCGRRQAKVDELELLELTPELCKQQ